MKQIKSFLFCSLIAWLIHTPTCAQDSSYCQNLNFELGNFTNWTGYTWLYSTLVPSINTSKKQGIVSRRQTIMSDTTAYDANTGYALKKVPSGYLYSARLGDEITSSDGNPRCWEQSLRYTMTIDSSNALLIIKFALVLQYADDHDATSEPRFRFTIYDENGNKIDDCSNYDVYSSNSNVKGFNTYTPSGAEDPVKWRDWTTVGADLLSYLGKTITIEFMAADCIHKYHYGYAYFVAECSPLYITVNYCYGDSVASLTAPEGFESYSWTDNTGTVIDTSQIHYVTNPVEGATYTCKMVSATGCTITLQSTIAKYIPEADFSSYMLDCKSNKVQFFNLSTTTHGTLSYKWDFGDGNTSEAENPRYTFSTSGMHTVSLALSDPPSSCVDTLTKDVESFSPPLVGIEGDSTYCPDLSVYLKAYGAYDYTWSNGSKADSIEVSAPGGEFWLLGRSSTGCVSDTIYKTISEEPDWVFSAEGDTILCAGNSYLFKASGAVLYLWNTKDTTDSIIVSSPGVYTVTGANARGCEKSETFNVVEYPIPDVDFTMSSSSINSKHNQLSCSIPSQTDVQFVWDMGDGSSETGTDVQHAYTITNDVRSYTIVLTATSKYNCADSTAQTIDVVPFIPNVFSPNNDGINELFMPDIDLEVFDHYGVLLYKGTTGWDGKYNGRAVDPDTYFFLIRYANKSQQVQTKKGYITLVR